MDSIELMERFRYEIARMRCDIRAEALLAQALVAGLGPGEWMVCCDSLFHREFSRDVFITELKEEAGQQPLLLLHLTRGGFYDQLPEGLFFQPLGPARNATAIDMALDYRHNRKKEEEIRRFFQPLENDLFYQRVQIEKEETRLLSGWQTGILDDYFVELWGLSADIPQNFILPLILLLPQAHRIAGDLALTAACLRQLLQEELEVVRVSAPVTMVDPVDIFSLGSGELGVNMVCGGSFFEDYPVLEWRIGPLAQSAVGDYLEGGRLWPLMETVIRYFVPVGVDISLLILPQSTLSQLVLDDDQHAILGYSSVLTD
jgi:hypothetical protein